MTPSEHCGACGRQTKHTVALEIRQENESGTDMAVYSREPYRVTTCRRCGTEQSQRMNDA